VTQPTTVGGRPQMPPPGAPVSELLVAKFRGHARRLWWSALVLIVVSGACGYFFGGLPAPFENWMLFAAAATIVLFAVLLPYLAWWSRTYTITTRRVISRSGVFSRHRRELAHARGYSIDVRSGILQRMWGAGTLTLSNGVEDPLRLVNVPSVNLVHEALVDQVEVSQILAHRDAQSHTPPPGDAPR